MQQGTGGRTHGAQRGGVLFAAAHHAGDHVAVASQELGRAVQHVARAQLRGILQHGSGEGGVDQHRRVAGGFDHGLDVDQVQGRVAGGLDHHQRGVVAATGGDLAGLHELGLQPAQPAGQQVVGGAVQRAHHQYVAAVGLAGHQHRGQRSHAGAVGHAGLGPFQCGDRALGTGHGRVVQARVDRVVGAGLARDQRREALAPRVQVGHRVGGRQVQRRRVHAQLDEILATGVYRGGVETTHATAPCCGVRMLPRPHSASRSPSARISRRARLSGFPSGAR